MSALYPVICSSQPAESAAFYRRLLDLEPTFETDWYVSLASPDLRQQIAFVDHQHGSVPEGASREPSGVFVAVEVDDVEAVHRRAVGLGLDFVLGLCDEDWGWRHFMVRDPHGLVIDVYEVIAPKGEYAADYTALGLRGE